MRSARVAVGALLMIGLVLAGGNLWSAAVRSTIPLDLNGMVTQKETKFEKHKGKDDVYLLWLDDQCYQVDRLIYESVEVGSQVDKQRFSNTITVDGQTISLVYSRDASGMLPAMALLLIILSVTGRYACRFAESELIRD
jgi:hypothetical protein